MNVQVHSGKANRQGEEDAEDDQPGLDRLLFHQDDDQGDQDQGQGHGTDRVARREGKAVGMNRLVYPGPLALDNIFDN